MCYVHCQDDKRRFRLSGLSQVGHDQIQPVTALADPIAALYRVSLAAVFVCLRTALVCLIFPWPAKLWTGQADAVLLAEGSVFAVTVDGVCQNRFRVLTKSFLIPLCRCLQPNPSL